MRIGHLRGPELLVQGHSREVDLKDVSLWYTNGHSEYLHSTIRSSIQPYRAYGIVNKVCQCIIICQLVR